jgi:hypothetical protein
LSEAHRILEQLKDEPPAYPFILRAGNGSMVWDSGLSKREYFAGLAMQGLLAGAEIKGDVWTLKSIVPDAVAAADALLKALEEKG